MRIPSKSWSNGNAYNIVDSLKFLQKCVPDGFKNSTPVNTRVRQANQGGKTEQYTPYSLDLSIFKFSNHYKF